VRRDVDQTGNAGTDSSKQHSFCVARFLSLGHIAGGRGLCKHVNVL
jgi:hypothetical protein